LTRGLQTSNFLEQERYRQREGWSNHQLLNCCNLVSIHLLILHCEEIEILESLPCDWSLDYSKLKSKVTKRLPLSGFVNMSASWDSEETWEVLIVPFDCWSQRKWYLTSMCFDLEWCSRLWVITMTLLLSQYWLVGDYWTAPIFAVKRRSQTDSLELSLAAIYFDSIVDNATQFWRRLDQVIVPWLNMNTNPEVKRLVSVSPL
jgi:hypothetical protein